jgi:hypothetical protein
MRYDLILRVIAKLVIPFIRCSRSTCNFMAISAQAVASRRV